MWETTVHLAVAGGVYDGVWFVLAAFPQDVLDEIWDLIETVFEGFLTYFFNVDEGSDYPSAWLT